jgi:hypothetical protein
LNNFDPHPVFHVFQYSTHELQRVEMKINHEKKLEIIKKVALFSFFFWFFMTNHGEVLSRPDAAGDGLVEDFAWQHRICPGPLVLLPFPLHPPQSFNQFVVFLLDSLLILLLKRLDVFFQGVNVFAASVHHSFCLNHYC